MEMRYSDCAIVIPVYNEEATIGALLQDIIALSVFAEIIVINDCSTDATREIVQRFPEVLLLNNFRNMGNGACVKKGILKATKDFVLLLDADGQHPPHTIPRLLDYAFAHDYDLVVASRKGNQHVSGLRTFGNRIFEGFASYLSGTSIDDLTSGFRVFRRSAVMKILHLFPSRYSYPTTSVLALLALGYNVGYLRIPEIRARAQGKSGVHLFKDFFRFLGIMLKIAVVYSPAKIFLPLAGMCFLIGMGDMIFTLYFYHNIQDLGVIAMILAFLGIGFALFGEQLARIRIEIGVAVSNEIEEHNRTFH